MSRRCQLATLLVLVLTLGSACGRSGQFDIQPTPTPVPNWTALDANVRLRDFLIGFAEQVADDDFMMPIVLLDGFASWSAKYVGEGWWRVSAQNTGRESNEVTPTPTMTPTVTPIPAPTVVPGPFALPTTTGLSWDELMARFADDSATPTAEPQLVTVTELVSGQWLVSERTGHVAADDDASEAFLECVAIGLVFGCY